LQIKQKNSEIPKLSFSTTPRQDNDNCTFALRRQSITNQKYTCTLWILTLESGELIICQVAGEYG